VIRVERRAHVPMTLGIAASIVAASVALIVTALLLGLAGTPTSAIGRLMLSAAFGSPATIVALATPLMLIGLASVLTFRVGLINLGAEGQIVAAALTALAVSSGVLQVPPLAIVPLAIAAGAVSNALALALIVVLKLRLRVDEAVVTILLNIAMLFAVQLLTGGTLASLPPIGAVQPLPIANAADLPGWGQDLHGVLAPLIAVIACLMSFALLRFTIWGLEIRATGGNTVAARFAGVRVNSIKLKVAMFSGLLIGLVGAGQAISTAGGATPNLVLGLGYAGIAVAFLAARDPLGVIPAALFVSVLLTAIGAANRETGVPLALGNVVVATLLIAALMAHGSIRYRLRFRSWSEAP